MFADEQFINFKASIPFNRASANPGCPMSDTNMLDVPRQAVGTVPTAWVAVIRVGKLEGVPVSFVGHHMVAACCS